MRFQQATIPQLRLRGHPSERGSIIVTAFVLTILAAIAAALLSETLLDHQNLNKRRRELWKAFLTAEAGIAQVQHWALYPDEFTVDPTLFEQAEDSESEESEDEETGLIEVTMTFETRYPNLHAEIYGSDSGYVLDEATLDQMGVGQFSSQYEAEVGTLERIELHAPEASDPIACSFKIESTGRSLNGRERRVIGYANINPVLAVRIPAGLISFENVATSGNARIHWGEAWSYNNMSMQPQNQYSYLSDDPKAIWRTMGQIDEWGGGWRVDTATNPDVLTTQDDMGVVEPYLGRFLQNQPESAFPAPWPEFDYETFKAMAMSHGRYYTTDAAGQIYRDGIEDAEHQVDFLTEFGVMDHASAPYDLIFIDTTDGNPPAENGANLSTISVSGNSLGVKGVFYCCANVDASGVGSPPPLDVESPYGGDVQLSKIFLHGVMYMAGTADFSGNAGVYGSLIAERGFVGTGTPDIYYNQALGDGLEIDNGNVGGPFKITLQNNTS